MLFRSYGDETALRAPFDGEVSKLYMRSGEVVGSGTPVLSMYVPTEAWVALAVREDKLPLFEIGSTVEGTVPALGGEKIAFKVASKSALADFATWRASGAKGEFDLRSFELRLEPVAPEARLRPGMSVRLFADVNNHLWLLSGNTLYGVDDNTEINVRHTSELQDVAVYNNRLLLQFFGNGTVSAIDMKTGQHQFDVQAFTNGDTLRFSNSSVILPDSNIYYQIRNGEKEALLLRLDIEKRQWTHLENQSHKSLADFYFFIL